MLFFLSESQQSDGESCSQFQHTKLGPAELFKWRWLTLPTCACCVPASGPASVWKTLQQMFPWFLFNFPDGFVYENDTQVHLLEQQMTKGTFLFRANTGTSLFWSQSSLTDSESLLHYKTFTVLLNCYNLALALSTIALVSVLRAHCVDYIPKCVKLWIVYSTLLVPEIRDFSFPSSFAYSNRVWWFSVVYWILSYSS